MADYLDAKDFILADILFDHEFDWKDIYGLPEDLLIKVLLLLDKEEYRFVTLFRDENIKLVEFIYEHVPQLHKHASLSWTYNCEQMEVCEFFIAHIDFGFSEYRDWNYLFCHYPNRFKLTPIIRKKLFQQKDVLLIKHIINIHQEPITAELLQESATVSTLPVFSWLVSQYGDNFEDISFSGINNPGILYFLYESGYHVIIDDSEITILIERFRDVEIMPERQHYRYG